ncbi:unnamed protein product [Spirodela intermedia]|uniref:Smr domain-containing protein n=1 Tax=Spirodela intermedia TaxID=51605 RepID=A0A7I8I8H7_SPIIN|nr:unnamed protein product [Spirodela intermedia]CAA6653955.1 unnamed protein product [Spirodela intermedia]
MASSTPTHYMNPSGAHQVHHQNFPNQLQKHLRHPNQSHRRISQRFPASSPSSSAELGPEFRGARSTRVVSKRHVNRPRASTGGGGHQRPPSTAVLDCLTHLAAAPPANPHQPPPQLRSHPLRLRRLQGEAPHCPDQCPGEDGRPDLAKEAFDAGLAGGYGHTVYAYSALISAYARSGLSSEALKLFETMKAVGLRPNSVTYNTVIDACGKGGEDLQRMTQIFREMLSNGCAQTSRAGHWEDAREMFDEMLLRGVSRDVFTYNTFIDAVCKCGNMEMAVWLLTEMRVSNVLPNVVTYSTLMDGYSKLDRFEEALRLYDELKSVGITPDRVCFNTLLSIFVKMGRYEDVVRTSEEMDRLGIDRDIVTYNALIAGYGKQGRFETVSYLVQKMKEEKIQPNVLTYSTLIDVYSKAGMYQSAMDMYMEFRGTGLKSDVVLYSSLIDTLCKNGLVESAAWLLNEMIMVGIRPNVVTFNSIIDAFGRSALVEEAGGRGDKEAKEGDGKILQVFGRLARGSAPVTEAARRSSQELVCIFDLFRRMHCLGIKPNVVTFSAILNACSRCDSFEDASTLLVQLQSFDNHVYGVARSLFDELKRMDSSTAAGFYNALTDMLWHFGQAAESLENTWSDSCLDLHLMSSGAAQAMVHDRELPDLLSILTGWGKHSKVAGTSSVRRAVEILLASMGSPFHAEKFNMGRFVSQGAKVSAWLKESGTLNALTLRDDRAQPNGTFSPLLSNFKALSL